MKQRVILMIKKLISAIRKNKVDPSIRPWGKYKILHEDENCKVKIIEVIPGQRLSLQSHEKRSEYWYIITGEGLMTLENLKFPLKAGGKVNIPVKMKHRIENTGIEVLKFVEIQTGSYFGEDDIIRYSDDYGRV